MIGLILMVIGGIVAIIGGIGLIRFPDVYTRIHAQTVSNVGGCCLVLFGVFLEGFYSILSVKALFLIILIFLTAPIGAHIIAKAAYKSGIRPRVIKDEWKDSR
jgi:multicomponent Na+:H+ antiporter subunit G